MERVYRRPSVAATQRERALRRAGRAHVRALRDFGARELGLEFAGSFERFASRHGSANWLYAVRRDRLASALPEHATFRFSWSRAAARRWERRHRARGDHTYLYSAEAHGGGGCPITPSLLAAAPARRAYVVLHEAWHTTLRLRDVRMPYDLEEASGRVVGVVGALAFARAHGDAEAIAEARAQLHDWGRFAAFVNRTTRRLQRLYRERPAPGARRRCFAAIRAETRALRAQFHSAWEREELTRTMNNAFFFRYADYTRHYPLALRAYRQRGSLRRAMRLYERVGREGALRELRRRLAVG
ncbi:MAG: hypothetical protein GF330_01140 [Candidatus Eisenbacteria bacterium]|nr:hypothetical protein [Candidatus Eisenbacteria bacterium]